MSDSAGSNPGKNLPVGDVTDHAELSGLDLTMKNDALEAEMRPRVIGESRGLKKTASFTAFAIFILLVLLAVFVYSGWRP